MKRKIFFNLCILTLLLFLLTGCYDAKGIEDLAYATAIGLDIDNNNELCLTLQFSISNSSDSGGGSNQSNKTQSVTMQCSSINSGISLMNSYISKEVNLSHCKVIVISEKLAEKGIAEYLDTFSNLIQIRPDCNVIISKCLAQEFIQNAEPSAEALTARYYEIALNSNEYTGYTTATTLKDLNASIKNTFTQGCAILGNVSNSNSESSNNAPSNRLEGSYTAGEIPVTNDDRVETFGTAVFYDDKLVGELNGSETICHLLVTNKLEECTMSIPDPFNLNSYLDLHIHRTENTKVNVEIINNSPLIHIHAYLEGYGLTLDKTTNYHSENDLNILNNYAEEYVKMQLENYLYKTSKEFNSDIAGFGKYVLSKYLTWDEWLASDWLKNYKNAFFEVSVDVNIKSGAEFNKAP